MAWNNMHIGLGLIELMFCEELITPIKLSKKGIGEGNTLIKRRKWSFWVMILTNLEEKL